ncbi:hypothetical protein TIFTF001_021423 [Ficus carica]|uniref:WRKY domain-containing protein n=1 Tax=Ficus carica TaxID=3494 RepID=A0AA88AGP3_FICCA|nr:hypothetical protein TIFTF001_021423 [Ficus carica]
MELLGVQDLIYTSTPPPPPSSLFDFPLQYSSSSTSSLLASNLTTLNAHKETSTPDSLNNSITNNSVKTDSAIGNINGALICEMDYYRFGEKVESEEDKSEETERAEIRVHDEESYYRCTSASCNVKKRVERSFSDPSVVMTTYEGQHTHPSPLTSRQFTHGGAPPTPAVGAAAFALPFARTSLLPPHYQFLQHQQHFAEGLSPILLSNNFGPANLLIPDHGLLQDIVPSHMLKQK